MAPEVLRIVKCGVNAPATNIIGIFGGSTGYVGRLVKGIDRDRRMSLDEGNSR
jgi:hypothetical protein